MNYYNEHDPRAAAWLRELIKAGLIPDGYVDTRSIIEVSAHDLREYNQCHFFAGIGGWPLALALAGVDSTRPLWTGSCPCQPFSVAGKGKGTKDERHLWPAFARLIAQCSPPIVFGEQVASKPGRQWLARVRADLEGMGYAVAGADLCAAGVGAPHIRQRIYWVGDADGGRRESWELAGARDGHGDPAESTSLPGRLADASGKRGAQQFGEQGDGSRWGAPSSDPAECPGSGWVGDTNGIRHEKRRLTRALVEKSEPNQGKATGTASGNSHWDSFDLLPCTDGKARRVEPGTFPLAYGIPGRVGLLRGYGNAIVPQVAAAFIEAALIISPNNHETTT